MGVALIPAVAFMVLALASPSSKSTDNTHKKISVESKKTLVVAPATKQVNTSPKKVPVATASVKQVQKTPTKDRNYTHVEKMVDNEDLEYNTILSYIKGKFTKIQSQDAESISKHLVEFGKQHQLDPKFAAALMARESAFNKKAVSRTGAKGLGQIKDFNYPSLKINDPFDIKQNVSGTTQYIKEMLSNWDKHKKTKGEASPAKTSMDKVKLALASYYKGFTAVKRDKGKFDKATDGYVSDILKNYEELVALQKKSK